jgi:hypothetical protein
LSRKFVRGSLYVGLFLAFLLHNDLWLWSDGRLVAGLPVGLTYHVGYCVAVAILLALLVRAAWPFKDETGDGEKDRS